MARAKQQKSEFVCGLGTAFEFVKSISDEVRKLGGDDNDLRKVMSDAKLCKRIAEAIVEGNRSNGKFPSLTLAADLIPEGWTVVEDIVPSEQLDISQLKPKLFINSSDKDGYITGEEMRKRAVELKGNLGLCDAKRLLAEQDKIPKAFRGFYIPLPGTVLRDPDGSLCVPYLGFRGGCWDLFFGWLGNDWDDYDRFACSE